MRYYNDLLGMFTEGEKMLTLHFSVRECRCKCNRKECDAPPMDKKFMAALQRLRHKFGKSMPVSSASRCSYWNTAVGGSPRSLHLLGKACDIRFDSIEDREIIAKLAEDMGFGGIGKALTFLHIDDGPKRSWTY